MLKLKYFKFVKYLVISNTKNTYTKKYIKFSKKTQQICNH